jgi:hypothetical protein
LTQLLLFKDEFWRVVGFIEGTFEDMPLVDACKTLQVTREQFFSVLGHIKPLGIIVPCLIDQEREIVLFSQKVVNKIQVEFSLSEYLSLQMSFPHIDQGKNSKGFFKPMFYKILELQNLYPEIDVVHLLEKEKSRSRSLITLESIDLQKIKDLETAILLRRCVSVNINNEASLKRKKLLPHRLVFIDGKLNLVAEDIYERSILHYPLSEVMSIQELLEEEYPGFSTVNQIDEFLIAIRGMNGDEVRLVLKLSPQREMDLLPDYHFFHKPYVTNNDRGDLIWTAYAEKSQALYLWLFEYRKDIEILSPENVRQEFLNFCQTISEHQDLEKKKKVS